MLLPSWGESLDPQRAITQYSCALFRTEEGLPQNTVRAIAQTPEGYLWFGTQAGLARFDGVRFKIYDRRNTGHVFDNHHIYALAVDSVGTLWIGTNGGGLVRFARGTMKRYGTADGLPTGRVTALEPGISGELYIGTYGGGLARLKNGEMEVFDTTDGLPHNVIFDLDSDGAGGLFIGTYGGGVSRFVNGRFDTFLDTTNGLADNGVFAVHRAGEDLWIGTNGGLQRYRRGELELFTTADGLSHNRVLSLAVDRDGVVWVGTYGGGLNRKLGERFDHLTSDNKFPNDNVWSLFVDREETLWAGTLGGGLVQLRDGPFLTYSAAEGLASQLPSSFYESEEGTLFIGSRNQGLSIFDRGRIENLSTLDGLSSNNVWTVVGNRGDLFVGTTNKGLNWLSGGRWSHFSAADGLADDGVFALAINREGDLFIGTNKGLQRYRDGELDLFTVADGLASDQIRAFREDRSGDLWIGTTGGVSRFDGERFETFSVRDGLSSNNVWSIHEDPDGVLWMGTSGGGLVRYREGEFFAFTTREGLFDDDLTAVLEDDGGFLWIGSSRGIFRIARENLNAFAAGTTETLSLISYGTRDGLKNASCYGGEPAGLKTRDGRLWFTTLDGIATVDPSNIGVRKAPSIFVEKVIVDARELPEIPDSLPHDAKSYEFYFAAPTSVMPDKVRIRYRLEGFDETWREAAAKERSVSYNNLKPGAYTFRVMASDEIGRFRDQPAAYSFFVRPAFYQTPAFYSLSVLATALFGYGLHRFRVRHLRRREKELSKRVTEALDRLKVLRGLLPICCSCKKIRDDEGYWQELEIFIDEHSEASFSHGMCPTCVAKFYKGYLEDEAESA